MKFIKKGLDTSTIIDPIFSASILAHEDSDESTINATIGSLFDDEGKIVAYDTFYDIYSNINNSDKARYADDVDGPIAYKEAIKNHILEDRIKLPISTMATVGGTGAVSVVIKDFLEENETILLPNIGWASYYTMAREYKLNIKEYDIYNADDIANKIKEVAAIQDKVVIVINSPCHNPTGLSMSKEEWQKVMAALNSINKPAILLNDIAYIDYSYDLNKNKEYFSLFNEINDNVLVAIAVSLSKSMTAYGTRTGALILIAKNQEVVDECHNAIYRTCRSLWSNPNNASMLSFSEVMNNHKDKYLKEKDKYVKMLENRIKLFEDEAKVCNLDYYPYNDGFFVTIKVKDELIQKAFDNLLKDHIYAVKVNHGIRIAICSIPTQKIKGLATRLKKAVDNA